MSDFNETYADAINSNSEERTSSMSDYSTSTTPNETRYQENTPTVTPEIGSESAFDGLWTRARTVWPLRESSATM